MISGEEVKRAVVQSAICGSMKKKTVKRKAQTFGRAKTTTQYQVHLARLWARHDVLVGELEGALRTFARVAKDLHRFTDQIQTGVSSPRRRA